ncbi:hypothetical protein BaRGS_00001352 [Batillaria attramentaria]|uniref:Uncharacterized protein n=1 Tax=Batillaria attramentaria TaxID=370345 RepID=A0ABD0M7V3_9CAEN
MLADDKALGGATNAQCKVKGQRQLCQDTRNLGRVLSSSFASLWRCVFVVFPWSSESKKIEGIRLGSRRQKRTRQAPVKGACSALIVSTVTAS